MYMYAYMHGYMHTDDKKSYIFYDTEIEPLPPRPSSFQTVSKDLCLNTISCGLLYCVYLHSGFSTRCSYVKMGNNYFFMDPWILRHSNPRKIWMVVCFDVQINFPIPVSCYSTLLHLKCSIKWSKDLLELAAPKKWVGHVSNPVFQGSWLHAT